MELPAFVTETLKQVVSGVKSAQGESEGQGAEINPALFSNTTDAARHGFMRSREGKTVTVVDFDVALTVVEGQNARGGAGLFVGGVGLGGQAQTSTENSSVSRIKFRVPIALP